MSKLLLSLGLSLISGLSTAAAKDSPQAIVRLESAAAHFGSAAQAAPAVKTIASVVAPGASFTTEVRADNDGNLYFRQVHGDGETLIAMHEGVLSTLNREGEIVAAPPPMASFATSHALHWEVLNAAKVFSEFDVVDDLTFAGEPAVAISVAGHGGQPTRLMLRESDNLPLGVMIRPDGETDWIKTYYYDWIVIGGVNAFSKAVIVHGADIYTYQFTHIEFADSIEDDFALPS